jgi:hypothetical protein
MHCHGRGRCRTSHQRHQGSSTSPAPTQARDRRCQTGSANAPPRRWIGRGAGNHDERAVQINDRDHSGRRQSNGACGENRLKQAHRQIIGCAGLADMAPWISVAATPAADPSPQPGGRSGTTTGSPARQAPSGRPVVRGVPRPGSWDRAAGICPKPGTGATLPAAVTMRRWPRAKCAPATPSQPAGGGCRRQVRTAIEPPSGCRHEPGLGDETGHHLRRPGPARAGLHLEHTRVASRGTVRDGTCSKATLTIPRPGGPQAGAGTPVAAAAPRAGAGRPQDHAATSCSTAARLRCRRPTRRLRRRTAAPYNVAPDALLLNYKSVVMTFVARPHRPDVARIQVDPPLAGRARAATVPLSGGDCGDYRGALRADFSRPEADPLCRQLSGQPARRRPGRWPMPTREVLRCAPW